MNETPNIHVTVAILTKNPGEIFREVLPSVLNQDTPWSYEVLVIDSGSTDGTVDYIKRQTGVRLKEIESREFGHGKTRNLAMALARGEYVAMLTHDAKPANNKWLANLVAPLEADSTVGGSFGRHIAYPSATPLIARDLKLHFDHFLEWPKIMGIDDKKRYKQDQGYRQVLHFFSDNNACLSKSVWSSIPYPDVDFAEDQLWAKTMLETGYKRAYTDNSIVFHSHDYSVYNTFRRSFDESRALKSLFGYVLCPSFFHVVYQIYACTYRDVRYLKSSVGLHKAFLLVLKVPFLNLAKNAGFYIGGYQGRLKGVYFWLFSLDGAKKRT